MMADKKKRYKKYFGVYGWYARRPLKWKYGGEEPIQESIRGFLGRYELLSTFGQLQALKEMMELLGKDFMTHMRPVSFTSGTLLCVVDSPVWSQQYSMMKNEILARLAAGTHAWQVRDIRFKVGSFPESEYLIKEEENGLNSRIQQQNLDETETAFLDSCLEGMEPELYESVRGALETLLKYRKLKGTPDHGTEERV